LAALGFDVIDKRTVDELEWQNDDVELLKWARRNKRILLGFDLYKGQTGPRLDDELRRRGGRVITIAGGPQQPTSRALGKLLFHQETWEPFFEAGHGKVRIETVSTSRGDRAARIKTYRPEELPTLVGAMVKQGVAYLRERKDARQQPRLTTKRARVAREQGPLPE
jgi:hypothetical protein